MYPRVSDLFSDLFGIEFPFPIYSFGLMLALCIIAAAYLALLELDRMYENGQLSGVKVKKENGRGMEEKSPSVLVGMLTAMAAILGVVGAKLFHILENLDAFAADPSGMIFSSGGLTFYGGLLLAAGGIIWTLRSYDLSIPRFADAVAPGLMLGYGIGRIGCYLAGDGDWGVCSDLADKPEWIPAWLWSEQFPRSILDSGNQYVKDASIIENCGPAADGVYPTMLYETAMAFIITAILWAIRKHPFKGGWLMSVYLVFNGIERFLIEQIRVNNVGTFLGIQVTQAEVIAVLISLVGVAGLVYTTRRVQDEPSVT
jgi:phosphatidylglycerol:prolipoprotein diacylglycerol transferase